MKAEDAEDKEKMQSLIIDYIDGVLTNDLKEYVENYIKKNEASRKEYEQLKEVLQRIKSQGKLEPDKEGMQTFLRMLQSEKQNSGVNKARALTIRPEWSSIYKIAAAIALVIIGFIAGRTINKNSRDMELMQAELRETKELVLLSLTGQESASERIKGVMASYQIENEDDDIINALIKTMNYDENINVRIAAVEALERFSKDEKVRTALINALTDQEYPAVQIRLIDLLVKIGDKRAAKSMQKVADDDEVIESVRDQAQMGIFKLM